MPVGDMVHRCRDESNRGGGRHPARAGPRRRAGGAADRDQPRRSPWAVGWPAGRAAGGPREGVLVPGGVAGAGRLRGPGGGPAGLHAVPQGHDRAAERCGGGDVPGIPSRLHPPCAPRGRSPSRPGGGSAVLRGLRRGAAGLGAVVEHAAPAHRPSTGADAGGSLGGGSGPGGGRGREVLAFFALEDDGRVRKISTNGIRWRRRCYIAGHRRNCSDQGFTWNQKRPFPTCIKIVSQIPGHTLQVQGISSIGQVTCACNPRCAPVRQRRPPVATRRRPQEYGQ